MIQEDLKGVEIPENPNYGYDEAYYNNYSYVEAYYDNYDHPRTYRMSMKITEDKCMFHSSRQTRSNACLLRQVSRPPPGRTYAAAVPTTLALATESSVIAK